MKSRTKKRKQKGGDIYDDLDEYKAHNTIKPEEMIYYDNSVHYLKKKPRHEIAAAAAASAAIPKLTVPKVMEALMNEDETSLKTDVFLTHDQHEIIKDKFNQYISFRRINGKLIEIKNGYSSAYPGSQTPSKYRIETADDIRLNELITEQNTIKQKTGKNFNDFRQNISTLSESNIEQYSNYIKLSKQIAELRRKIHEHEQSLKPLTIIE